MTFLTTLNSKCYLCGSPELRTKHQSVRDRDDVSVLECQRCGLVFLSSFDHITADFYSGSRMHSEKLSVQDWLRETARDDQRRAGYLRSQIENKSVLDFGCGNGGFLLRAREFAERVAGVEPEEANREYFQEIGLKVYARLQEVDESFDTITLFHVLEHLPDPRAELTAISQKLAPGGSIVIEVPNANDALLTLYRVEDFENFTYWSCHLFLFTAETLLELFKQVGFAVDYIRQIQRYPLSNHLHWLARRRPGGHKIWGFLDSANLTEQYEARLASLGMCDTLIARVRPGQT